MNGLVIVLISIVALGAGYLLYGRWLARKWGIDENAQTPAKKFEDGQDFVPSSKFTVFSHQFSSIAGAGPVTGPILASVFGWVPVLLWLIVGGLFFGAVQDFGALYASVKNEGKSMGMIIEKYIGKAGRKLFMLFCWLFTLLVIAAFTDMVAGTFVGKGAADLTKASAYAHSSAASISMLFILVAVLFGLLQKKVGDMPEWSRAVVAIAMLVAMFAIGMKLPMYATKSTWIYIIMAYLFLASIMPMWLLMQPRDYMTTFMLLGMIIGAVVGVVVAHPAMKLNAYNGFVVGQGPAKSYLFPTLFVTIACGPQRFLRMVSSVFCPELRRQSQPQQFLSTSLSFSFDLIWLIFSYTSSILNFSYHRFLSLRALPSRLIFSYDFQPIHPNMTFQGKHHNNKIRTFFQ